MPVKFRTKEVDNPTERLICTGLIVSDHIISELAPILDLKIFTAKYTKTVASWCLEHFSQFQAAPKAHIQGIFEGHKENYLDDEEADLIEAFLLEVNDHFLEEQKKRPHFDERFVLHTAEEYIQTRSASMLAEDIKALLSTNRVAEAMELISTHHIPQLSQAQMVTVFGGTGFPKFWEEDDSERNVLFKLPGSVGELVGPIERDSFISILAPEKRGKTFYLMWMAITAYRQRCNVAFFGAGDMTEKQMKHRLRLMLTGRDTKRPKKVVTMPVLDCLRNQQGDCPIGEETDPIMLGRGKAKELGTFEDFPNHKPCDKCFREKKDAEHFICRPWHEVIEVKETPIDQACKDMRKQSGNKSFSLFTYPAATLTVAQINAKLDILQQQNGFMPDVIVIDYADLLDAEPNARKLDYRHQINATWMALRAMSQVRNCAVLTATQAKLEAMKKSKVDQWDTSEDKRKLAHVTAMIALNQTMEEKRNGIMNISKLADRESDFDTNYQVGILQCLAIGKPHLVSFPYKTRRNPQAKDED